MGIAFDLQDFILRARVLKLYRQALRTAKRAPSHSRGVNRKYPFGITKIGLHYAYIRPSKIPHRRELLNGMYRVRWVMKLNGMYVELQQTIRHEIEKNRDCRDKQKIRFLLSEGKQRVKNLDEMLDMQGF